jgi:hypothetical protein
MGWDGWLDAITYSCQVFVSTSLRTCLAVTEKELQKQKRIQVGEFMPGVVVYVHGMQCRIDAKVSKVLMRPIEIYCFHGTCIVMFASNHHYIQSIKSLSR